MCAITTSVTQGRQLQVYYHFHHESMATILKVLNIVSVIKVSKYGIMWKNVSGILTMCNPFNICIKQTTGNKTSLCVQRRCYNRCIFNQQISLFCLLLTSSYILNVLSCSVNYIFAYFYFQK